jgi:hypothetical protein
MADMARIFSNCRLYNSPETEYFKWVLRSSNFFSSSLWTEFSSRCANTLERYFQTKMKEIGLWDKWCSATTANPDDNFENDDNKRPSTTIDTATGITILGATTTATIIGTVMTATGGEDIKCEYTK